MPEHKSVLLEPVLELFKECRGQEFWDATLGLGGHSLEILRLFETASCFGSDQDSRMLELAQDRFREANLLSRASFQQGGSETFPFKQQQFDFIPLDIGLSSLHINHFDQGISFLRNEPLDMRMDMSIAETAADLLVQRSEESLLIYSIYTVKSAGLFN